MRKLTSKNYENLPEVKKKKEDEKKRLELLERKAATKNYLRDLEQVSIIYDNLQEKKSNHPKEEESRRRLDPARKCLR